MTTDYGQYMKNGIFDGAALAPIDLTAGGFQGRQNTPVSKTDSIAEIGIKPQIMRHDDMVTNLLRTENDSSLAMRQTLYRNLLDLMMQNRESTDGQIRPVIFAALDRLRPHVDVDVRSGIARRIARQRLPQAHDLVAWLLSDEDITASDILSHVQLDDRNWLCLLPKLDAGQRAYLGARTDLNEFVTRALFSLGQPILLLQHNVQLQNDRTADQLFLRDLPTATPPGELSDEAQQQVRDLIQRIDEFRRDRDRKPASVVRLAAVEQVAHHVPDAAYAEATAYAAAANDDQSTPVANPAITPQHTVEAAEPTLMLTSPLMDISAVISDWQWETDRFGVFTYIQAGPLTNPADAGAVPSLKGQLFIDWCTSSPTLPRIQKAIQRRCGFRDAPVPIVDGTLAGLWTMSAVPVFEVGSGVFKGYRGTTVRQRQALSAEHSSERPAADHNNNAAEILAAMAHETRTPLNAIMGYAELIEMQPFGKINQAYHAKAAAILQESHKLLRALDDVSDSARLEQGAFPLHAAPFDIDGLLNDLLSEFQPIAQSNGVALSVKTNMGLPMIWSDRDVVQRCLGRLIFAMLSTAHDGEQLVISLRAAKNDHVQFSITRPERLKGMKADALFDPLKRHQSPASAPYGLGIGFGLRLVRQLAMAIGGTLEIEDMNLHLTLPAMAHISALKA